MNIFIPTTLIGIAMVESSLNPSAFNYKEQAHGLYQIRPCVLADIERIYGVRYTTADCYNPRKAARILDMYTRHYLAHGKWPEGMSREEATARIWNGGPNGAAKNATEKYWEKVK
jgi:hypothetical protein